MQRVDRGRTWDRRVTYQLRALGQVDQPEPWRKHHTQHVVRGQAGMPRQQREAGTSPRAGGQREETELLEVMENLVMEGHSSWQTSLFILNLVFSSANGG